MADNEKQLDHHEGRDARRRVSPRAAVVFEAIRQEGESELSRKPLALFWSGLAAGLSMGFSFVAETLLSYHLPADAEWTQLITKFGYSVGFLIVVLGRQQLFTENTLTPMLEVFNTPSRDRLWRLGRLWSVVLVANMLGALLFAAAVRYGDAFSADRMAHFQEVALKSGHEDWWTTFAGAIFAGWLIALMVWLMPFAETGRIWIIVIVTYMVGLGGFGHIIAGSVETLYLVIGGQMDVGAWLGGFFLPVLAGNVIGGVSLVAAVNSAQVKVEG
ncbi:formate/nitrite transporter family protein [uncultured Abyssibacter sp.]|uniref:formate/nitrite transporter family protein n=1 Tax=uncultured Abyssibacter sp. TaxID=2320202 RepID=UPI0032B1DE9E